MNKNTMDIVKLKEKLVFYDSWLLNFLLMSHHILNQDIEEHLILVRDVLIDSSKHLEEYERIILEKLRGSK